MQASLAQLTSKFYQVKDSKNTAKYTALVKELQGFIDQHHDAIEVDEQIMVAQALEYQLALHVFNNQAEQAEAVEQILNNEFYGIHKIAKPIDVNPNAPMTARLNLSHGLLDLDRLRRFAIKQKGTTKPKLLGWLLKGFGFVLIALTAWLFSKQWIWTPLIIGIVGVLLTTIGSQVTNIVNRFLSSVAFNTGYIIPGVVTKLTNDYCEVVFMAPMMKTKNQTTRWGLKSVSFKNMLGFKEGNKMAGVCVFSQQPGDYFQDFMPTPVCLGYSSDVIAEKAKQVIAEKDWDMLIKATQENTVQDILILDKNLQKIK